MNSIKIGTVFLGSCWMLASVATAQNPAILLREGDALGPAGQLITGFGETQTNNVGGLAVDVTTTDGTTGLEHFWGFPMSGGAGAVIQSDNVMVGNFLVTAHEGFFGYADNGSLAIGMTLTDTTTMTTGIDSCWVDLTQVLNEGDNPITEPMFVSRFNSRPGMINATGEPVWIGGLDDMGGTNVGNRLYRGAGHTIVLQGGTPAPAPLVTNLSVGGIGFDFKFSSSGTHYISEIDTELPSSGDAFMVIDGAIATTCTGTLIGEGELIPVESGGLPGEAWGNFDSLGINDAGDFMICGDTGGPTATDEFVSLNGSIVLREGDVLMDLAGGMHTLGGSIDYGCMNDQGDILIAWNNDLGDEILILNGVVILAEGDEVDWDNDGALDAGFTLDDLEGSTSGGISARSGGMLIVYGQIDVNDPMAMTLREGVLSMELVPPPSLVPVCAGQYPEFCNGDGGNQMGCTSCPCGNNATAGTLGGCLNSAGTSASLSASGSPSVSLPMGSTSDLRFQLSGAPPTGFCILNSGDGLAPGNMANPCFGLNTGAQAAAFDGLRCAITNTRRHGGRSADGNGDVGVTNSPWGGEGGPPVGLAQAGPGFASGQTRYFQVINRDDVTMVCMRGLNTSQAVEVTFIP